MADAAPPEFADTPTSRTIAIREAGARGDVAELARQVEALVAAEHERRGVEKERARSATLYRLAGGLLASLAITMGGRALILAQDAAIDHQRLGALTTAHEAHVALPMHYGTAEQIARVRGESNVTAATLVEVRDALVQLREEMRELRRETASRRQR